MPKDTPTSDPTPSDPQPPIPATPDSPANPTPTPPEPPGSVLTPSAPGTVPPSPEPPMPAPGQVITGGFTPQTDPNTVSNSNLPPLSPAVAPVTPSTKKRLPKPVIAGLVVLLLLLGGAIFYFGFYNSPSAVYSQSLSNTAKGYDKLIEYSEKQAKADYKGFTLKGGYEFKQDTNVIDGEISAKGYEGNGTLNMDVGFAGTRVNGEARFIKTSGPTPDVYVKVDGLQGLGEMFGSAEIEASLSQVNNQWIFIDHTLLESLAAAEGTAEAEADLPADVVIDAAKSFGEINKEYVYTTAEDKAIFKVVENKGKESFGDRQTYRYELGFNKDNLKKYIDAQKAALQKNKLGEWLKANGYEAQTNQIFADMKESAGNLKESDTFDVWMDIKQRLPYQVRVHESNKGKNFVNLGLDYKGGSTYPFFLSGASEGTTFKMVVQLDSASNKVTFDANLIAANNQGNFNFKSSVTPNNTAVKVEKPEGAKPLAQVWQELGLGDLNAQLQALPTEVPVTGDEGVQAQAPFLLQLLNRS